MSTLSMQCPGSRCGPPECRTPTAQSSLSQLRMANSTRRERPASFTLWTHQQGKCSGALASAWGRSPPPAVLDGVVYLTAVNTAYALNEATGEEIWSYGTEMFPARGHRAVVADGVYYFAPDSNLYALDVTTGHMRWYYVADDLITDVPVVAEGMVYVRLESGVFYAVDAATGSPIWSWETTGSALRSPTVVNGFLFAESLDGYLRALIAATGEEVWSFSKGYFDGVPSYTIVGGVLYVGALDGSVYAFAIPSAGAMPQAG